MDCEYFARSDYQFTLFGTLTQIAFEEKDHHDPNAAAYVDEPTINGTYLPSTDSHKEDIFDKIGPKQKDKPETKATDEEPDQVASNVADYQNPNAGRSFAFREFATHNCIFHLVLT